MVAPTKIWSSFSQKDPLLSQGLFFQKNNRFYAVLKNRKIMSSLNSVTRKSSAPSLSNPKKTSATQSPTTQTAVPVIASSGSSIAVWTKKPSKMEQTKFDIGRVRLNSKDEQERKKRFEQAVADAVQFSNQKSRNAFYNKYRQQEIEYFKCRPFLTVSAFYKRIERERREWIGKETQKSYNYEIDPPDNNPSDPAISPPSPEFIAKVKGGLSYFSFEEYYNPVSQTDNHPSDPTNPPLSSEFLAKAKGGLSNLSFPKPSRPIVNLNEFDFELLATPEFKSVVDTFSPFPMP